MKQYIQTPEKTWRWRLIKSRRGCSLFLREDDPAQWCGIKACFLLCCGSHPPGARGDVTAVAGSAGVIFGKREQLWPLPHHQRSGAPGKRKRGGRKGCEGCCKQSAFTAVATAAIPISDIISHSLMFCVMYSFVRKKYRKSAVFCMLPPCYFQDPTMAKVWLMNINNIPRLAERQTLSEWALLRWPITESYCGLMNKLPFHEY